MSEKAEFPRRGWTAGGGVAQTSFCDVCELCFPSRCGLSTVNQPSGPSQTCKLPHVCATRRQCDPTK
jgi:hypothetical protein